MGCLVVTVTLTTSGLFVRPAAALPLPASFAMLTPGTGGGGGGTASAACYLPDGSPGVFMSDSRTCCPQGSETDASTCLFQKYLNPAIQLLAVCVGLIVVIALVYGGIEYITSAGDPQKAANAKKRIMSALIGFVAFLLLYAFLQFIVPGGIV